MPANWRSNHNRPSLAQLSPRNLISYMVSIFNDISTFMRPIHKLGHASFETRYTFKFRFNNYNLVTSLQYFSSGFLSVNYQNTQPILKPTIIHGKVPSFRDVDMLRSLTFQLYSLGSEGTGVFIYIQLRVPEFVT